MVTVTFKPLTVEGKECIGIYFGRNSTINGSIRQLAGARWDPSAKAWWVLLSKVNYYKLLYALNGIAIINPQALFDHYERKNRETKSLVQVADYGKPMKAGSDTAVYSNSRIDPVNAHVLPLMRQQLILLAYSPSTIKTYINEMAQLLMIIKNIPADELKPEHMRRYLAYCLEKLKLTENTLHSRINAIYPVGLKNGNYVLRLRSVE